MSNNKNEKEQMEQKVMTKYDRKLQRREEEKANAEKEKRRERMVYIIGAAIVVTIIAAFPLTIFFASRNTHITVGEEKVSRLEFDYTYNSVKNEYVSEMGMAMLSYLGYDFSGDLSQQMYSDELSWKDVFEETAVEQLIEKKAMLAEIEKTGFTYDTTEKYDEFKAQIKSEAAEANVSKGRYVREMFGGYANMKRIEKFVKEDFLVAAYYDQVYESLAPAEEEITAHYENNKNIYDSADYRITMVSANTVGLTDEAEIEKAKEEAREKAEKAEAEVMTEGQLVRNRNSDDVNELFAEWLFAEDRKAGDTTIIEDERTFYVLGFENRYLEEAGMASMRLFMMEGDGTSIYDEWKAGEATEDSFAELCINKSGDDSASRGGLYENIEIYSWSDRINNWLFDEERNYGDTTILVEEPEETENVGEAVNESPVTYILYYVGEGQPEWEKKAIDTLSDESMQQYVDEITAGFSIEDSKGKLNYLKVQAEASAE